ncbi:MAG: GDSL-type esterase/lipase family protein [Candidatus Methylumidiphilus sp.]
MNYKTKACAMILLLLTFNAIAAGQSRLVDNLNHGMPQTIVAYGTSLTEGGVWVSQLQTALKTQYPGLVNVINSGKAGRWSTWGVDNLESRVIDKKPDTVFIEFAINDAYLESHVTLQQASANIENMVSRIHKANRQVEIFLMVMNPPIGKDLENRPQFLGYYQMYRDVAKKYKLGLIDHYPNWERILGEDKTLYIKYVPDGLHPGTTGCQQVVTPGILKALGMNDKALAQ